MREIFALVGSITMQGMDLVEKNFSKLDKTLNSIVKPIDKVGKSVENLGKKMTVLTAPIAAIGAGIVALSVKTGAFAESLLNLQQTTGISTDNLQRYKHVADTVGVSFDGLVGGASKLTARLQGIDKDGGNAYNALAKIGVSAKDSSGNLKKMNDLFPEVVSALQNVEDVTIRNSLANQIFGKDLKDMAPILGMTTKELDAMMKKADELGLVMDGKAIAAAAKFDDQVGLLKERVSAMGMQLATSFIPILQDTVVPLIEEKVVPAVQKFAAKIKEVIDWFKNLSPETQRLVVSIGAFVMVSGPALIALGKLIGFAKTLSTTILAVRTAVLALNLALVTNPITLTVLAVGALGVALASAASKYRELQAEHQKFTAMTVGQAGAKEFVTGWELLVKKIKEYGSSLNGAGKMQELIGDDITALTEKARSLGYTIEGDLNEQLKQLNAVALEAGGVRALNGELIKVTTSAKRAGTATKILTDDQIAAARDLAEKRAAYEKQFADELDKLILSEIELLDKKYTEEKAAALAAGADVTNLTAVYALRREQIIADETGKIKKAAQEQVDIRTKAEKEVNNTIFEMTATKKQLLERDWKNYLASVKGNKEQELNINQIYAKKISDAIEEENIGGINKTISAWTDGLSQVASRVFDIWSQFYTNQAAQIDNNYAKQKAAIESSAMDEAAKADALKKLDVDIDKKRAELRKKQAKEDKASALFSIAINTAVAVVKALPNFFLSAAIGILGAAQAATVAAEPLPLEEGGLVKSRPKRGILAQIGEGVEDEIVIPMKTGAKVLARMVVDGVRDIIGPQAGPGLAMAGGSSYGDTDRSVHLHIGTLVADDSGLKKLEREMRKIRIAENQRMGEK